MAENKNFYITTTLPYVNAEPHVGHAIEFIRADAIARTKRLLGYTVFFNTGTDEHGQKIFDDATREGKDIKEYADFYSERFKGLKQLLGLSDDIHFIRTTDPHHEKAAQEFWKRCSDNGYIYKKQYQTKYCVGCELEKTDSELVDGKCPLHPNKEIQIIEEENYFFKFSAFQEKLLIFYNANPDFVIPSFRFNEIKSFVERGLQDFSISRLKSKMSWGISVPGDNDHVMYVWFDALVNYISTLGWPEDLDTYTKFWESGTPVQYCGKDNLRQQTAMWQAMLMAAGLSPTRHVVIDGFATGEGGVKMSKSLGNTINPYDVVSEYGTEALRYFSIAEMSAFEDSPFTMERFKVAYNSKLANGIGNLTSRIMKMAETYLECPVKIPENTLSKEYFDLYTGFDMSKVCEYIWSEISNIDAYIQETTPFKVVKVDLEKGKGLIQELVIRLYTVARMLNPILPETSEKIKSAVKQNKMPEVPLFVRKD